MLIGCSIFLAIGLYFITFGVYGYRAKNDAGQAMPTVRLFAIVVIVLGSIVAAPPAIILLARLIKVLL